MALTFDEILSFPYDINAEYLSIPTTVTITQEDGRTGWGSAEFYLNKTERSLNAGIFNAPDLYMAFSDRNKFAGEADPQGVLITEGDEAGFYNVSFTLKRWGNTQFQIYVSLSPYFTEVGKLYLGYGPTIGFGSGYGLYTISFNNVIKNTNTSKTVI